MINTSTLRDINNGRRIPLRVTLENGFTVEAKCHHLENTLAFCTIEEGEHIGSMFYLNADQTLVKVTGRWEVYDV